MASFGQILYKDI